MLNGDFSSVATPIRDPLTGTAVRRQPNPRRPDRRVVEVRSSRTYCMPNSPRDFFRGVAPVPEDTWEGTARVDHQITDRQRIYGRWVVFDNTQQSPDYRPDVVQSNNTRQHNIALNYTYNIDADMAASTSGANYMNSFNRFSSPVVGIENLDAEGGNSGFGRPAAKVPRVCRRSASPDIRVFRRRGATRDGSGWKRRTSKQRPA